MKVSTCLATFPRTIWSRFLTSHYTDKKGKKISNFAEIYEEGRRSVYVENLWRLHLHTGSWTRTYRFQFMRHGF